MTTAQGESSQPGGRGRSSSAASAASSSAYWSSAWGRSTSVDGRCVALIPDDVTQGLSHLEPGALPTPTLTDR